MMNFLFALVAGFSFSQTLDTRCAPQTPAEPVLTNADFRWDYTLPQLISRFGEILAGDKRLAKRAHFDEARGAYVFPYESARGGDVVLPARFIESVRRHVEEAMRLEYVDGIFFPDMGHSHFLIRNDAWARYSRDYPVSAISRFYEKLFDDPDVLVVYHTAEQLKMREDDGRLVDDRRTQWRLFSRNLVGDNRGEGRLELRQEPSSRVNTLNGLDGYFWYGAGFNISANKDGCFGARVRGGILRYDLSLYDLPE